MLKVGDKVRVRKDLEIADFIEGYYVTDDMYSKIGQVVTISEVCNAGRRNQCYEIEELPSLGVAFTDGMFELDDDTISERGEL